MAHVLSYLVRMDFGMVRMLAKVPRTTPHHKYLEELLESGKMLRGLLRLVILEQSHSVVQVRQVVSVEIQGL